MKYDKAWYKSLIKPKLQPNEKIFPLVWIVLYILMVVSFMIIIFSAFSFLKILALILFTIQLTINLKWTEIFFIQKDLKRAFELSVYLFIYLFLTVLLFYFVTPIASILQLPYLIWSGFAIYLSYTIYKLNT
jgi:tryptophan-rich sensory protein